MLESLTNPCTLVSELPAKVRWLIGHKDVSAVLKIAGKCFESPGSKEDLAFYMKHCDIMIAEANGRKVGFMIYERNLTWLNVCGFGVDPEFHRRHVGSAMIDFMKNRIPDKRHGIIVFRIRETNLRGQLFLKKKNFKAVRIMRNHYEDTGEAAYVMQFALDARRSPAFQLYDPFALRNRMSE